MQRGNGHKKEKLEEKIRNDINVLLRRDFSSPVIQFCSVTNVLLSSDCTNAKVYWDTFNPEYKENLEKELNQMKGKIRGRLGGSLNLRKVPHLSFFYDSQYEDEQTITKILNNK